MKTVTFDITTAADGSYDSTTTTNAPTVKGQASSAGGPYLLYAVEWVDTDFDAGVDAVLSVTSTPSGADRTLLTLTNADAEAWYYAQVLVSDNTGTATTFYVPQVVDGKLKLVVSAGGNVKTGKCLVYLMES
jgi:hypothetical protein